MILCKPDWSLKCKWQTNDLKIQKGHSPYITYGSFIVESVMISPVK